MSDLTQAIARLNEAQANFDAKLAVIDNSLAELQERIEGLLAKHMPSMVDDRLESLHQTDAQRRSLLGPDVYARRQDDAYQQSLQRAAGCFDDQD